VNIGLQTHMSAYEAALEHVVTLGAFPASAVASAMMLMVEQFSLTKSATSLSLYL